MPVRAREGKSETDGQTARDKTYAVVGAPRVGRGAAGAEIELQLQNGARRVRVFSFHFLKILRGRVTYGAGHAVRRDCTGELHVGRGQAGQKGGCSDEGLRNHDETRTRRGVVSSREPIVCCAS